jgi:hypothetical protein
MKGANEGNAFFSGRLPRFYAIAIRRRSGAGCGEDAETIKLVATNDKST